MVRGRVGVCDGERRWWDCVCMTMCEVTFPLLQLHVWQKLNKVQLRKDLQTVLDNGIRSLAVVLMHSYT